MSIRSVHSDRALRIRRSAYQFPRGVRGGILTVFTPSLAKTSPAVPVAASAVNGYGQYRSPIALVTAAASGGLLVNPGAVPVPSLGRRAGEDLACGGVDRGASAAEGPAGGVQGGGEGQAAGAGAGAGGGVADEGADGLAGDQERPGFLAGEAGVRERRTRLPARQDLASR
jgi:hypothetical protein